MKSYWQERDYLETSSFISPRECPYCGFHVCFDASYIEQFKPNEEIPLLCPNTGCASNRDDGVMRLINIPEENHEIQREEPDNARLSQGPENPE